MFLNFSEQLCSTTAVWSYFIWTFFSKYSWKKRDLPLTLPKSSNTFKLRQRLRWVPWEVPSRYWFRYHLTILNLENLISGIFCFLSFFFYLSFFFLAFFAYIKYIDIFLSCLIKMKRCLNKYIPKNNYGPVLENSIFFTNYIWYNKISLNRLYFLISLCVFF